MADTEPKPCILDLDSPSYPPQPEEFIQCGCESRIREIRKLGERGELIGHYGRPENGDDT